MKESIFNNNKNGEKFEIVLNDYIDKEFVQIIDYREVLYPQIKAYNDCLRKNFKKFDYLLFYDIDEFIFLRNFPNSIQLNWFFHTDNNLLYYDNRKVVERFPEKRKGWDPTKREGIKSILKGNITINISDPHKLSPDLITCNGFGKIRKINLFFLIKGVRQN